MVLTSFLVYFFFSSLFYFIKSTFEVETFSSIKLLSFSFIVSVSLCRLPFLFSSIPMCFLGRKQNSPVSILEYFVVFFRRYEGGVIMTSNCTLM